MAAKKKEVTKLTLAEIGVEADEVGWTTPDRSADGHAQATQDRRREVHRRGEGGSQIAQYLVSQKII